MVLRGAEDQKPKQKQSAAALKPTGFLLSTLAKCGSWLACECIAWVYLIHQGARIAGKPAPTEKPSAVHKKMPLLYTTQAGCQAAVLLLLILILGAPSNTLAGIRQGFGG
ncbi:hypothetical protein BK649_00950 [Pseudomonas canadensis]|uniref:Uncharacterized protein n=1 Tax=Pseudomonas canadensis TaxID=915099 RepID=A0A423FGJ8_9PSED|nr:hypothetical protein BK649_00950 [Pseudomonas canadensis]